MNKRKKVLPDQGIKSTSHPHHEKFILASNQPSVNLSSDIVIPAPDLNAPVKLPETISNNANTITVDNNLFAPILPTSRGKKVPHYSIGPEIGPDPSNTTSSVIFEQVPYFTGAHNIKFDFAYGYRILLPPGPEVYLIRIWDQDSGMLLEERQQRGGDFFAGDRKYFIRYRIEIFLQNRLIFEHNYDCTNQKVYVHIPDGGLGDNLAWLPYVELFRQQSKADVCCVIGEWMIRLVGDLYPGLNFMSNAGQPMLSESYANYFCGIFNRDKKNWRPVDHQFLGMQGAIAAILKVPGEPLKCRLHRGSKRPFPEPFVCISTLATNPGKYWNYPDGWNQIIRFLRNYGYRVLDIDRDNHLYFAGKKYAIPTAAEDFTGRLPIQDRISLLEHADFFIGLPSGLSWLAWDLDVPVVMLSGFTMPISEFPTPYRVTNYLFCHGCWNDSECFFDAKVPIWCPKHVGTPREIECTRAITPKMVRETILQIPAFQRQMAQVMNQLDQKGRK